MGEGDGIEMSARVSFTRSLVRVVVEEAVVHLEPAEHIPADVTSRGVIGKQGGREKEREWVCAQGGRGLG